MLSIAQDPTEPGFVQDPYRFYDQARALGDVVDWTDYGMAAAVSHRAVQTVLRDPRYARVPPGGFAPKPDHLAPFAALEARSLLNLVPPDHTKLRAAVARRVTTGRFARLALQIKEISEQLIAEFPQDGFDLMAQFCAPLPVRVIAALLGVPVSASDQLLSWSHAMCRLYTPHPSRQDEDRAAAACREFSDWLTKLVEQKRSAPGEDVLSDLASLEAAGEISRADTLSTAVLLLNAGHEATVLALGNATALLCGLGHRGPVSAELVEEALRLDPPLHIFTRWAQEDLELFGHPISAGDEIACLLGAANRDPDVFPKPDHFDPSRHLQPNTAFGLGRHFCLGAYLARLEMQIALSALFTAGSVTLEAPLHYADRYHFHGPDRLMVRLH